MNLFPYHTRESFIYKLDPRTKVFVFCFMIGLLLCFNHPLFTGGFFQLAILLSIIGRVIRVWQMRMPILALMVGSGLMWSFYLSGSTVLWSWWIFRIYQDSLMYGIAMALRLGGIIITGLVFLSITRPDEFHAALLMLKVPYPLAFTVSLSFRLAPLYAGVAVGVREAQVSRGLDLHSGSLLTRIRNYMSLAVPFFMYAVRQTDQLTIALESRGFAPNRKRTSYRQYQMQSRDYALVTGFGFLFLGSVLLRISGVGVLLPGRL